MAFILSWADLEPFGLNLPEAAVEALVEDAEATARRIAPCLSPTSDSEVLAAAKAVLRRAVLRAAEQGSGAMQTMTAGPYGATLDTRTPASRGIFYPSEEAQLRELCESAPPGRKIRVLRVTPTW